MSLDSDVRRLAATRPFNLLPREAVQLLAFSCDKRALKTQERLFSAGEPADAAYFVLDGEIALETNGDRRQAGPGVLIGEMALLTIATRGVNAEACQDSRLLKISRETFLRILTEFPEAAAKVQAGVAMRARTLLADLEALRRRAFAP